MDYWLCVSVCVFLCSHDNDTKCSNAESQPQWKVWYWMLYHFVIVTAFHRINVSYTCMLLVTIATIRPILVRPIIFIHWTHNIVKVPKHH